MLTTWKTPHAPAARMAASDGVLLEAFCPYLTPYGIWRFSTVQTT